MSLDRVHGPLIGIYPGTFDPLTLGHMDIIKRAARVVDKLVIAVARNDGKGPLFNTDERVAMVRESIDDLEANRTVIEVLPFDTLLMEFCHEVGARVIIRGLRAVSDFEYEFQMAGMNSRIDPTIETLFLMASERQQFIASRFVKEIGRLGGDISSFVSPKVDEHMRRRFAAMAEDEG
jgi:pantetheine-phosphate adenylyltransferase